MWPSMQGDVEKGWPKVKLPTSIYFNWGKEGRAKEGKKRKEKVTGNTS